MKSYIKQGYRNLSRRPSRSILTVLGVVLAIGFTVGLLSISEGFMRSLDDLLMSNGPDLFVRPRGGAKMPFGIQGTALLDEKIEPIIRGIPDIAYVEPVYMAFSTEGESTGFGPMMTMISGLDGADFFKVRPTAKIASGRFFRNRHEGMVVVLGSTVAENTKKKVGERLELISGHKLKVIGIMAKSGEPYDYFAYSPIENIQNLYGDKGYVSYFLVKSKPNSDVPRVTALLRRAFPKMDIQTVTELVESAKKMMSMARAVHFGISCFALVIGVLFVACTMIMSVSERVREFAMLRVVGASKSYVVKMILSESVILSLVGGVLGCLFGFLLSKAINVLIGHFVGDTFLSTFVSPRIFLTGVFIAILIGTFAGIFPALMVMRRNIAESLRYE